MDTARDLASRLLDLLRREHAAMADFLVALADFDRQRLWVGLGYTSLFYFLHRELKLSSGAAFHRKTAAELIQRFPEVVAPLRDGRLCLSSACELARVLTPENRGEVLPRFFHASKQEAKAVAAEIRPAELLPVRTVVTTLPLPATRPTPAANAKPPALEVSQSFHPGETSPPAAHAAQPLPPPPSEPPRSSMEPLTSDLRRLHITVSKSFMKKLTAAGDALSHSHPGADEETILEAGLDLLIERAAKRRGLVEKPRQVAQPDAAGSASPRHIAAHVRREVWTRDRGCCQWPMADGGICASTTRAQFDHILPVARGGESTVENLRLVCAVHNDLAARRVFGDAWMDRFTRRSRPAVEQQVAP